MATKKKAATTAKKNNAPKLVEALIEVLSGTYVLGVKTHGFHWNVTGPLFPQLHEMFGKQYEALFEAADEVAERIRALGFTAPGSMEAFLFNTTLMEEQGQSIGAEEMVAALISDHQELRKALIEAIEVADDVDDNATEDMLIQRVQNHDKTLWMLRALMQ